MNSTYFENKCCCPNRWNKIISTIPHNIGVEISRSYALEIKNNTTKGGFQRNKVLEYEEHHPFIEHHTPKYWNNKVCGVIC